MRPNVRVLKDLIPSRGLSQSVPSSPGAPPSTYPLVHLLLHLLCKYTSHRPLSSKPPLLHHPSWLCQCDNALSPPSLAPLIRIDLDKYPTMI